MDSVKTTYPEMEEFLNQLKRRAGPRYRTAPWLLSDFDDPVWNIRSDREFSIDWRVHVGDGGLLTAMHHETLWRAFRSWMIVQTHVDVTGGKVADAEVERRALQRAIYCIDYFLLNAEALQISAFGLDALTVNNFRSMYASIISSRFVTSGIYNWSARLTAYLRDVVKSVPQKDLAIALDNYPILGSDIPDIADRFLDLSDDEIVLCRAALHLKGLYKENKSANDYRYAPDCLGISRAIFPNTLWGFRLYHTKPTELFLSPGHRVLTEYPRAPVTVNGNDDISTPMGRIRLNAYLQTIVSLNLLRTDDIPVLNVKASDLKNVRQASEGACEGRYISVPIDVTVDAFRKSVEFALQYGEAIVDSYLAVAKAVLENGQDGMTYAVLNDITPLITNDAKSLGISRWSIEQSVDGQGFFQTSFSKEDYYTGLRSNVGLYECIRVLYGAVEIVVGSLMARRQGELEDLKPFSCFDVTRTWLVFRNRKSGYKGKREQEARPIPPLAVRLISMIERLQSGLVEMGAISTMSELFNVPKLSGTIQLTKKQHMTYNESLDYFCDWAQTALDENGKRFYIRQHQLRRFFAMVFFWGGGFGGIDTLRWFLGHTNCEHLWHYITESIPGETLRSVAAEWVAYGVKHATKEGEMLSAELSEHFGTSNFSVIEDHALEMYLEDLIDEGRLIVEPLFLDNGNRYRIAVVLKPRETRI